MNYLKIIPAIFILLKTVNLSGQTVQFDYDSNGNRTSRSILIAEEVQSRSVSFPVNPESLSPKFIDNKTKGANNKDSENAKSTELEEIISEDSQIKTLIFPNPTKGLLKIEISNLPTDSKNEMRLYDMNGIELIVQKNLESFSELDINHLKDGLYILRIRINSQLFDFKIIKNR